MKTSLAQYLGKLETAGGPFCITNADSARLWNNSTVEYEGDYWDLCDHLDQSSFAPLFRYSASCGKDVYIFNTENANCLVFVGDRSLIFAEMISCMDSWCLPWSGILFVEKEYIRNTDMILSDHIVLFDAALSGTDMYLEKEGFIKTYKDQSFFDIFKLELPGELKEIRLVEFKNEHVFLSGIKLVTSV